MIGEFCTWCREYIVNGNSECRECESCLGCKHFDEDCCMNETVVSEYKKEWDRPASVVGIGPPLCRKYCPYLSELERRRAHLLAEGDEDESKNFDVETQDEGGKGERSRKILFTPLPKFWLNENCPFITFEVDFNETVNYHMALLGWCEWEIPERLTVEIPAAKNAHAKNQTATC